MGLFYRVTQFWWNISARPLPEPYWQEIAVALTPVQCELFSCFSPADQWHAYRVFRSLKQSGETQADLLTAALLHDIGKTRVPLTVWDRMAVVIAARLLPAKSEPWGEGEPTSWRRPFVVRHNHPRWGAEMARDAGASDLAIRLIARHQSPAPNGTQSDEDRLLRCLQEADDLN